MEWPAQCLERVAISVTDSTSFNQAGLPGIGMAQDPIEYGTHTWHTNLEWSTHPQSDAKKAAVVVGNLSV